MCYVAVVLSTFRARQTVAAFYVSNVRQIENRIQLEEWTALCVAMVFFSQNIA